MAENMIPNGLPYGERQKLVAARQQAGLPLNTTGPPGPATPGAPTPPPPGNGLFAGMRPARQGYDPLTEATPDQFPAVTQTTAIDVAAPVDETDALIAAATQSKSLLVRMVAERLANQGR